MAESALGRDTLPLMWGLLRHWHVMGLLWGWGCVTHHGVQHVAWNRVKYLMWWWHTSWQNPLHVLLLLLLHQLLPSRVNTDIGRCFVAFEWRQQLHWLSNLLCTWSCHVLSWVN
jgi:hypothetical protein